MPAEEMDWLLGVLVSLKKDMSLTPAAGNLTPSSGFCGYLHTSAHNTHPKLK